MAKDKKAKTTKARKAVATKKAAAKASGGKTTLGITGQLKAALSKKAKAVGSSSWKALARDELERVAAE